MQHKRMQISEAWSLAQELPTMLLFRRELTGSYLLTPLTKEINLFLNSSGFSI